MTTAEFMAELQRRAEKADRPIPAIAAELVAECRGDDDLLVGITDWLFERAPSIVGEEMRKWAPKPERKRAAPTNQVQRFGTAAKAGDLATLSDYRLTYVVNGVEKPLGAMTSKDHQHVATSFQQIGESSLMLAAVHRQIAKLIGGAGPTATTESVISEAKYAQLLERLAPSLALAP